MKRFIFVVSAALLITTNLFAQNQAPVAVPDFVSVLSEDTHVTIVTDENYDLPVASDDYATLYFGDTISLNVLDNDYSPTGEPLEIYDVSSYGNYYSINDSIIMLSNIKPPLSYEDSVHEITYYYRIREKNNPSILSDWGAIHLTVKRNPHYPAGINDVAVTKGGFKIDINLLENDLNPLNTALIIYNNPSSLNKNNSVCKVLNDSSIEYTPYADFSGVDTVKYYISLKNNYFPVSYGYLIVNVQPSNFFGELDINNIKAGFNANGYLFDNYGFLGIDANLNGHNYIPAFEAPKGSGSHAIFCGSLWIGGYSNSGQDSLLHLAAVRYMQNGDDFWYGPVSDNYDEDYDTKWIGLWKLSKSDIAYHINHYNDWGYVPKAEISTWPGNGDESNGQMKQLAPFFDQNGNGIYEPMDGDYPLIRGDEAVYFIFNDARLPHTESQGKNLGVEIHGMAYAFNSPSDSALWNTVFVHYDIFNRSDTTYFNTYIGNFLDTDLGNPWDDYILSDVQRGAMISYNGDDYDEDTQMPNDGVFIKGYGEKLPAVAGVILGGPYMDEDGIDNPSGGCDESINGMNFGNNVVDDERWGMEYFGYFNNGGSPYNGDPSIAPEYYYTLHGFHINGSRWMHNFSQGLIAFNYYFPGNSDSCNYGTGGIPTGNDNWTEETGNNGDPNPPGDRRGLLSTGPFTFHPGDKQVLDMAYVFARSYDGSDPVNIVKDRITDIRAKAIADSIIELPDSISGLNENHAAGSALNIFPNPLLGETIYIDCRNIMENINYKIYNSSGIVITGGKLKPNKINSVTLPNINNGFYIIRLNTAKGFYYGKLIKQ